MENPERPAGDDGQADPSSAWGDLNATLPYTPPWTGPGREVRVGPAPVDLDAFASALTEAGLLSPGELAEHKSHGSAATLARSLIRSGRLTPYQAAAFLQGKAKGLFIGNYLVLDKVGAGGMGLVFKARHRGINRVVALKVLPPSYSKDRATVLRFRREARAVAQLDHPNVVAALDAGEFHGLHYFVMEFVEGRDLARLVRDDGLLPVSRAVDYTVQAARGLSSAHSRGVYHRDIKPSNLLLDVSGTVKVSDLGIARIENPGDDLGPSTTGADDLTREGVVMGTVDFMAPEQAYNSKLADHRSDVYSLGCTLYYLLTGEALYPGETLIARLLAHRQAPIPSVRDDRPDVPPALDSVLQRMLAKAPEDRYPSMDALIADLEPLLPTLPDGTAPGRAALPPSPETTRVSPPRELAPTVVEPAPPARPPVSNRVVLVATAVLGLTAVAVYTDLRRVRTGELLVQAGSNDVRVMISRDGRLVDGPTGKRSFTLAPGDYTVAVDGPSPRFQAVPPQISVYRDKKSVVRIEPIRVPPLHPSVEPVKTAEAPPPKPSEPTGVVRSFGRGEGKLEAVAVSDDGLRAVTGGNDRSVRLWEVSTGREVGHGPHDGPVFSVALFPDARRAVSASADRTVRLWDLEGSRELGRFAGHTSRVNAVAVSPGGGLVLTGGDDQAVRLFDAETRALVSRFRHDGRVNAVAFVPGFPLAVSGGDDRMVRLWDTDSRTETGRLDAGGKVFCLAVSPDGRRALSGCDNGRVTLWDLASRSLLRDLESGPRDWVRSACFLPPGGRALAGYQGGKLVAWEADSGRLLHALDHGPVARLGLSPLPDGAHVLTADDDGLVRLWHLPVR